MIQNVKLGIITVAEWSKNYSVKFIHKRKLKLTDATSGNSLINVLVCIN